MPLEWSGDAIKSKVREAARFGVDKAMAQAVIGAKSNHPGWSNRTGTAEGSIRVVEFASEQGSHVRGLWGSADVDYMIWLELHHGGALRSAADVEYPRLADYIREAVAS